VYDGTFNSFIHKIKVNKFINKIAHTIGCAIRRIGYYTIILTMF